MAFIKRYCVPLIAQGELLRRMIPESHFDVEQGMLRWWGWITPSSTSVTYKVRLTFRVGQSPVVHVLKPELIIPVGEKLPHIYPGNALCLYFPDGKEWHGGKILAQTVLPWLSEWLYYYEIWAVTGQWNGGGTH